MHRSKQLRDHFLPYSPELYGTDHRSGIFKGCIRDPFAFRKRTTFGNSLSFLGLGVKAPTPEWGAMLSGGRAYLRNAPHLTIFPGIAIIITILSLNLLGDGLRDALDPKLKK